RLSAGGVLMRTTAVVALLSVMAVITACSDAGNRDPMPQPTLSSEQHATPTPSMETVAKYYARQGSGPAGADDELLVDETAEGSQEYVLPDLSEFEALGVGFTCDVEADIRIQIGAAQQPGSFAGGAEGCVDSVAALVTPALDPARLPHTVAVSAPDGVEVSIAVYGVPRLQMVP
ncbi:MAG: hypothetical protein ACRYF3_11860, partial [Janthinobacterium lividum]